MERSTIEIRGAFEHNLKHIDLNIPRGRITVITGVSGSGKSSLAFDTILAEANRRFFYTLSHYSRQFLDLGSRPALRSASGLSPAIALAQNETQPSVRATVASLTDIGELLGILFARFAEKRCPKHDLPTESRTVDDLAAHARAQLFGKTVAILVCIADQKKGQFRKVLEDYQKKGYARAYIDGDLVSLEPIPVLAKEEKHDIDVVIDVTKVEPSREARLRRSLETALTLGEGTAVLCQTDAKGVLDKKTRQYLSLHAGCPVCSFSWPKLDSRHFSPNSLGRCLSCDGRGLQKDEDELDTGSDFFEADPCRSCGGTGLLVDLKAILFRGRSIHRMYQSSIAELENFFTDALSSLPSDTAAQKLVLEQLTQHLRRLKNLGLDYLGLGRRILSLSNGEAQRLRLSSILSEQLRGVLYVLDEPSQGLHASEIERINVALKRLRDQGNTVLVVDHDPHIMQASDWIVDLGPDGGRQGGHLLAQFAPKDAAEHKHESLTARYLADHMDVPAPKSKKRKSFDQVITLHEPNLHNLKIKKVRFPLQAMTVVTGVSGAGKSSLVLKTLYRNLEQILRDGPRKTPIAASRIEGADAVTACTLISRKPIAKSSVSMPATWLDIFTELRQLFATVPEAQIMGLNAGSFSLSHDEGRCPECKGRGVLTLTMKFLADAEVPCPICSGKRYKPQVLEVRYGGLNLSEVLELSIAEAVEMFQNHRLIQRRLQPAVQLGLGYLKLGQPSSSLSGGESQRLKLVPYLAKKTVPGTVLLMDEPTAGLHFRDVALLLDQLQSLVAQGATLIIVEHDQQVIQAADWVLELGPGSGDNGGQLLSEGPPK